MYRALIVCNSRFPEDPGALSELHGPKMDGVVLRDALLHHEAGMFEKNDIRILNEGDSLEVCRAIDDFFGAAESDDTLLFYYSGHGNCHNQQLFLCTRNTVVDRLNSTAISEATLKGILSSSFSQVKILVFDCCFSGLFKGSELADGMSGTGRYIIAATSATGRISDSTLRGLPSPFTRALADALISKAEDKNGDGAVDLDDIYAYLSNVPFGGPRPQRNFDGAGAVPIARRPVNGRHDEIRRPEEHADDIVHVIDAVSTRMGTRPYLDTLAPDASLSSEKVSDFRQRMRADILQSMPRQLTPAEFLQRAGLFRNGSLTYAGVLLFGDNPTTVLPSAIVQCTRFYGTTRSDALESIEIQDTVPSMIVGARDFIANLAAMGETPTADGAYAETTYSYPMIAVREIIANAVVHRDYEVQDTCAQIHAFADRVEVISPGGWGTPAFTTESQTPLGDLEQQSQRRNFRLAQALTWSKLVEGVGAGIPRALADCRAVGAPEPMVSCGDRMVTVTIYPRPVGEDVLPRSSLEQMPTWPSGRAEVNPSDPVFFLSYARAVATSRSSNRLQDSFVTRFFDDLSENVAELVVRPAGAAPGFMDRSTSPGSRWTEKLLRAIGTCHVFVPLLSYPYVSSSWCAREWDAFSQRRVTRRAGAGSADETGIIPVLWTPVVPDRLPQAVGEVQRFAPRGLPDVNIPARYAAEGVYGLMRMGQEMHYQAVVWRLAQSIAEFHFGHEVDANVLSQSDLRDIFRGDTS
jgi:predicted HTH transcriptional regulator